MQRTSKNPKKKPEPIQRQLDRMATPHDVPSLGAGRVHGLFKCFGAVHRTMAKNSFSNYSERIDRRADVCGSPVVSAGTAVNGASATVAAGRARQVPDGNHGDNLQRTHPVRYIQSAVVRRPRGAWFRHCDDRMWYCWGAFKANAERAA